MRRSGIQFATNHDGDQTRPLTDLYAIIFIGSQCAENVQAAQVRRQGV